ncbi:hypothetical protein BWQ96_05189 [Gracilariopsis chorda]|uniref:Uncharacterized protein n=1 Tax=Gracilariopsis chorda TaxID=448386 RepID=A0A2V3ISE0_9FLOR|nr:hypothetical protein BWQ96_05189 [Gracilariopsis chorda]|eukprot:PXF45048.1 hypothetical protein BWQ96_05189 [Gracilariopsis chorda]
MSLDIDFFTPNPNNEFLSLVIAGKSIESWGVKLVQSHDHPGYMWNLMHVYLGYYYIVGPFIETTEQFEILVKIVKRIQPALSVTVNDEFLEFLVFYYCFTVAKFGHLEEKNTFKSEVATALTKLENNQPLVIDFIPNIDRLIVPYPYKYSYTMGTERTD